MRMPGRGPGSGHEHEAELPISPSGRDPPSARVSGTGRRVQVARPWPARPGLAPADVGLFGGDWPARLSSATRPISTQRRPDNSSVAKITKSTQGDDENDAPKLQTPNLWVHQLQHAPATVCATRCSLHREHTSSLPNELQMNKNMARFPKIVVAFIPPVRLSQFLSS